MSYYTNPLPYLENAESSQLTEAWDLMHIVHGIQDKHFLRVRTFSYSHIKKK